MQAHRLSLSSSTDISAALQRKVIDNFLGLSTQGDGARDIDSLIAQLVRSGSSWDAELLSSGPWLALYTQGKPPRWQRQAQWLPWARNVASQDYDVGGGRVRNRGEIWGSRVFVTVEGELQELQPERTFTPKMFQAGIQSGTLHVLGLEIPLPIRGRGFAKLLVCSFLILSLPPLVTCLQYLDRNVRIFQSPKESGTSPHPSQGFSSPLLSSPCSSACVPVGPPLLSASSRAGVSGL